MRTTAIGAAAAAFAISSLVQLTPAPPVVVIPVLTSGMVAAGLALNTALKDVEIDNKKREVVDKNVHHRAADFFSMVPQVEFKGCQASLQGQQVNVTGPVGANNGIRVDGVPAACMNLANVLVNGPMPGPHPEPCGSGCLLYSELTASQYNAYRAILV